MEIIKDVSINAKHGDLEFRMGKALTSFYYKGVEKFVFRTSEVPDVIYMLQTIKDMLDKSANSVTLPP